VIGALSGGTLGWKSPPREDSETTWSEALRRHGWHSLLGILWTAGVYWLNPAFAWWLAPITGALALSVPVSVLSSRVSLGCRARKARLFLIPEEARPPRELRWTWSCARRASSLPGFLDAVLDPRVNALVRACAVTRKRHSSTTRRRLLEQAIEVGPEALRLSEKNALLSDADALARIHDALQAEGELTHTRST
jgi:membrane glycosyltransferase